MISATAFERSTVWQSGSLRLGPLEPVIDPDQIPSIRVKPADPFRNNSPRGRSLIIRPAAKFILLKYAHSLLQSHPWQYPIRPLDGWFPPEDRAALIPQSIEAGFYNGRFYRVPVRTDVGVLYYRKDLLPEPPRTWEEFETVCNRYGNPPQRYCIVFQGMQYEGLVCNYLEYLWGAGGAPSTIIRMFTSIVMKTFPRSLS